MPFFTKKSPTFRTCRALGPLYNNVYSTWSRHHVQIIHIRLQFKTKILLKDNTGMCSNSSLISYFISSNILAPVNLITKPIFWFLKILHRIWANEFKFYCIIFMLRISKDCMYYFTAIFRQKMVSSSLQYLLNLSIVLLIYKKDKLYTNIYLIWLFTLLKV
jgi:hypothetical protein